MESWRYSGAMALVCVATSLLLVTMTSMPLGAQENDPDKIRSIEKPAHPFADGVAAYDRGEFPRAREIWLPWAHKGDPAAQRNLAHLYRMGLGVAQDFTQAAAWYRLAADNGFPRAQANLAAMYLRGQGVVESAREAAYWFTAAATAGHVLAEYNLGLLYLRGEGVERSEAKAAGWLYRAASAGHKPAMRALGKLVAVVSGPAGPPLPPPAMPGSSKPVRTKPAPLKPVQAAADSTPVTVLSAASKTLPVPALTPDNKASQADDQTEPKSEPTFLDALAALMTSPSDYGNANDPEIVIEAGPEQPAHAKLDAGVATLHAVDFSAAKKHWQPMADGGDAEAQYQLGKLYLRNGFPEASKSQGFVWLARAAAQSHLGAEASKDALDQVMSSEDRALAEKLLQNSPDQERANATNLTGQPREN
ncbi:MAG: sel1 repeat family protein [Rhodospirillaceae bacterium]|nr:sel1 repeat family protein [Rhodospirillaceae bacterium]MBT5195181.1 sel1 repeat family protein [Rhodospirillaceae bacterium]MBT5898100.1 sel1 repeat family protein [Rhodospirillaceae bacterium]MBT6428865.1 sel1 repeat family protein [Rhodospirillaceae bacterium]